MEITLKDFMRLGYKEQRDVLKKYTVPQTFVTSAWKYMKPEKRLVLLYANSYRRNTQLTEIELYTVLADSELLYLSYTLGIVSEEDITNNLQYVKISVIPTVVTIAHDLLNYAEGVTLFKKLISCEEYRQYVFDYMTTAIDLQDLWFELMEEVFNQTLSVRMMCENKVFSGWYDKFAPGFFDDNYDLLTDAWKEKVCVFGYLKNNAGKHFDLFQIHTCKEKE